MSVRLRAYVSHHIQVTHLLVYMFIVWRMNFEKEVERATRRVYAMSIGLISDTDDLNYEDERDDLDDLAFVLGEDDDDDEDEKNVRLTRSLLPFTAEKR